MLTIEKVRDMQLGANLEPYAGYAYSLAERTFSFMVSLRMLCSSVLKLAIILDLRLIKFIGVLAGKFDSLRDQKAAFIVVFGLFSLFGDSSPQSECLASSASGVFQLRPEQY